MKNNENVTKNYYPSGNEDYVRSLEMSLSLLQLEVEHLRGQFLPNYSAPRVGSKHDVLPSYFHFKTATEIIINLHNVLSAPLQIIESNIFYFDANSYLSQIANADISANIYAQARHLEEQGVIDWAMDNSEAAIIMNITEESVNITTYFILLPLLLRGNPYGIFIANTTLEPAGFAEEKKELLKIHTEQAVLALDNIRSANEIASMNQRLNALNKQALRSSKLASIGELAASFAEEIDSPLKIIEANLQLIESGVGNSKRRFEIINEQLKKIASVKQRLSDYADTPGNTVAPSPVNICGLIDEVLLFAGSQLVRNGIKVEKEFENDKLFIFGIKPQIEHVLLNLILYSRQSMPEGGLINIVVSKSGTKALLITIADNGSGYSEEELSRLFDPQQDDEFADHSRQDLYILKNIITQHKGSIEAVSEIGKGSAYKIIFPLHLQGRKNV